MQIAARRRTDDSTEGLHIALSQALLLGLYQTALGLGLVV